MKMIHVIPVAAMILGLAGCASRPLALAPVGPNPAREPAPTTGGQLQVYSALQRFDEGDNLCWYQHTDYTIYQHGKLFKRVSNAVGYYETRPRLVTLPPGNYIVVAEGRDSLRMRVPVKIERGEITRIHLDDRWSVPADTPRNELVTLPSGYPVGWRVNQ
jgi:hypothetical protein